MVYIQYEFFTTDQVERDAVIAILPDLGFDGFEELDESVRAFIPAPHCRHDAVLDILSDSLLRSVLFEYTTIEQRNWNEEWEKNFPPVLIAGRVSVRAPFHDRQPALHELVIEPKMSFGTGHHATTALMIEQMLSMDITGKKVVDFGCGTGILAIMAVRLGAASVLAVDHEEWAVENSRENVMRNNAGSVEVLLASTLDAAAGRFDIMLANINRNVIMENLQIWRTFLKENGVLVVSGILVPDIGDVADEATATGFSEEKILTQDSWASILFKSN